MSDTHFCVTRLAGLLAYDIFRSSRLGLRTLLLRPYCTLPSQAATNRGGARDGEEEELGPTPLHEARTVTTVCVRLRHIDSGRVSTVYGMSHGLRTLSILTSVSRQQAANELQEAAQQDREAGVDPREQRCESSLAVIRSSA